MTSTISLVRHRVADFDAWKKVYDGFAPIQTEHGVLGHQVLRSNEEANAPAVWFHEPRDHAFFGPGARPRRGPSGSPADGTAPVGGGVLRPPLREATRVHPYADGPARLIPRSRFCRELPRRSHRW